MKIPLVALLGVFNAAGFISARNIDDYFRMVNVTTFKNFRLSVPKDSPGITQDKSRVDDKFVCVWKCLEEEWCFSMNMNVTKENGTFDCELLSTDKYNSSNYYANKPGYHHIAIKSPCELSPCFEGTCVALYETDDYYCDDCPPEHIGKNCLPPTFPPSVILTVYGTPKGRSALHSYLTPVIQSSTTTRWIRCWRASVDGWSGSAFHQKCDGTGPTITIVRVGKRIFGGYTDAHWTTVNYFSRVTTSKSFLFSLYNSGDSPVKLPITNLAYAVYGGATYGPAFGGGHDLYISGNANANQFSFTRPHSYTNPQGCSSSSTCTFFAGSYNFQPNDIEVFYETAGVQSTLLSANSEYVNTLTGFLSPALLTGRFKLCWSSATHGWSASTFHTQCDHLGPTVTVVQVGSRLFGGYIDKPWGYTNYFSSTKAFLFSLINAQGFTPFKFNIVSSSSQQYAGFRSSSRLPVFGGGHDLSLHPSTSANSYTTPHSYEVPPGCSYNNPCPFMAGSSPFGPSNIHVFYENILPSDILLGGYSNVKYLSTLLGFLSPVSSSVSRWVRCWRSTVDGSSASIFHALCDNMGPTVTVIRVGYYIFGGYTDRSWIGLTTGAYYSSTSSFLFSLYNINGYLPVKYSISETAYAIYTHSAYGPTFGRGHDMRIHGSSGSYASYRYSYSGPCSVNGQCTFFASSYTFTPSDVEVFYRKTV